MHECRSGYQARRTSPNAVQQSTLDQWSLRLAPEPRLPQAQRGFSVEQHT